MGRLALTAPPSACLFIIPFTYNLLFRHPECRQLIHRAAENGAGEEAKKRRQMLACTSQVERDALTATTPSSGIIGGSDVFDNNKTTLPVDSNAIDSSLWELFVRFIF